MKLLARVRVDSLALVAGMPDELGGNGGDNNERWQETAEACDSKIRMDAARKLPENNNES